MLYASPIITIINHFQHPLCKSYPPMQGQVAHCFLLTTCLRWSSLSAATIGSSFFRWYEIRWLMLSNNMSLVRTCVEEKGETGGVSNHVDQILHESY